MEFLEVKEIQSRLLNVADSIHTLLVDMNTFPIIGEINRPAVEKVKKIRKKRTPKVKGEAIPVPETSVKVVADASKMLSRQIEDKPRRKRVKRIVETPAPESVSSKGGVSNPFYDE